VASSGLHCRKEEMSIAGAPDKLGAPGPTWNLSFVFIMTFENAKVATIEKEYFFFKLNRQQKNF